MKTEEIQNTKEKIIENLEGLKDFEVSSIGEVTYSKTFKAKNKEELEEAFNNGELEFDDGDITDGNLIEDSLEITEYENEL